ncbi:hypothetical protein L873DRAFT_1795394 [Choiromyces venosus 120613-1]|uniref:Uncharacterized protein n=1 Tax=Choiromyces venosus 120613-1 TaxID=1336337 RepID=A0A3N4IWM4_9PEZI|nr:hypothetical protein L873DRAFT_1795394 [Choiromyces venosus 120613-1]
MSNKLFEKSDCETEGCGDNVTIATGVSTPRRPDSIPVVEIEKANEVVTAQIKRTLDFISGKKRLCQVIDIYLLSREWTALCTHSNHTASVLTHKVLYETSLETTSGSETAIEWDIAAAFKGLSIGIAGSRRKFTNHEVGEEGVTHRVQLPVQPGRTTTFYQRLYHFKIVTWFSLNNRRVLRAEDSENPAIRLETMHTIHAEETMGSEDRVSGVGELLVKRQDLIEDLSNRTIRYSEVDKYLKNRGIKW